MRNTYFKYEIPSNEIKEHAKAMTKAHQIVLWVRNNKKKIQDLLEKCNPTNSHWGTVNMMENSKGEIVFWSYYYNENNKEVTVSEIPLDGELVGSFSSNKDFNLARVYMSAMFHLFYSNKKLTKNIPLDRI